MCQNAAVFACHRDKFFWPLLLASKVPLSPSKTAYISAAHVLSQGTVAQLAAEKQLVSFACHRICTKGQKRLQLAMNPLLQKK